VAQTLSWVVRAEPPPFPEGLGRAALAGMILKLLFALKNTEEWIPDKDRPEETTLMTQYVGISRGFRLYIKLKGPK
jgi:hypothetical protein